MKIEIVDSTSFSNDGCDGLTQYLTLDDIPVLIEAYFDPNNAWLYEEVNYLFYTTTLHPDGSVDTLLTCSEDNYKSYTSLDDDDEFSGFNSGTVTARESLEDFTLECYDSNGGNDWEIVIHLQLSVWPLPTLTPGPDTDVTPVPGELQS